MKTTINVCLTIIQIILGAWFVYGFFINFENIHYLVAIMYILVGFIIEMNKNINYEK